MKHRQSTSHSEQLANELAAVDRVFPEIKTAGDFNEQDVSTYYSRSFWAYRFFHSWQGSIHMPISHDGKLSKDNYKEPARLIAQELNGSQKPQRILEIGCGTGFNAALLAEWMPDCDVVGLDLNPKHIAIARKRQRHLPNLTFIEGTFDEISRLVGKRFGLIFAVECFCHSTNPTRSLRSVSEALEPGGAFITIDLYRGEPAVTDPMKTAVEWVEKSMIVGRCLNTDDFTDLAEQHGLHLAASRDLSHAIQPILRRLRCMAKCFFLIPPLAQMLRFCLSPEMTSNAIPSLLMPLTIASGAHRYLMLSYRKPTNNGREIQ